LLRVFGFIAGALNKAANILDVLVNLIGVNNIDGNSHHPIDPGNGVFGRNLNLVVAVFISIRQ